MALDLVDYRTHARRQASPGEVYTTSSINARARGWSYKGPRSGGLETPTWGSMTCAGITGLAICEAALGEQPERRRDPLLKAATRARHDGFAWLARHMTVRCSRSNVAPAVPVPSPLVTASLLVMSASWRRCARAAPDRSTSAPRVVLDCAVTRPDSPPPRRQ